MNELPPPMTPADCELRDFPFMPLDVVRLRDSDISALSTGDEFRCAVLLWCASWHQVPAASLPDDDLVLSQFAGFGRVVKEWKKVRTGALRGWVKCSDGRLYHPVVAEKANDAWNGRIKYRDDKEKERVRKAEIRRLKAEEEARRAAQAAGNPVDIPDLSAGQTAGVRRTNSICPPENALIGRGKGIGTVDSGQGLKEERGGNCDSSASPSAPPAPNPNPVATDKTKGTRLPADWQLPKAWGEWALQEKPLWTASHARQVAEVFRDYWVAKAGADARKVDWLGTWRNWVRRDTTPIGAGPAARQGPMTLEAKQQASTEEARKILFGEKGEVIDAAR